jgi:hypothetical protein
MNNRIKNKINTSDFCSVCEAKVKIFHKLRGMYLCGQCFHLDLILTAYTQSQAFEHLKRTLRERDDEAGNANND